MLHGKTSADDDLEHFNQSCSTLKKEKMIQVSSDGANMNQSLINDLVNENCSDDELSGLISIATCGLHTIHEAFYHGAFITFTQALKIVSRLVRTLIEKWILNVRLKGIGFPKGFNRWSSFWQRDVGTIVYKTIDL